MTATIADQFAATLAAAGVKRIYGRRGRQPERSNGRDPPASQDRVGPCKMATGASISLEQMLAAREQRAETRRVDWIEKPPGTRALIFVLGSIAGSVDVIGFLGLNGLFTAHVTGNLVILAAHIVAGREAPLPHLISVPVFIMALAVTRLLAAALERVRIVRLPVLLLVQFVLLCAFLTICLDAGFGVSPNAPNMIVAGMLGVSAMAVQNALVRIALIGVPSTAVLTTNITNLMTDLGGMLLGRDTSRVIKARDRIRSTWPAIAGFLLGCVLGASCAAAVGLRSLLVPTGLALIAVVLGVAVSLRSIKGFSFMKRD